MAAVVWQQQKIWLRFSSIFVKELFLVSVQKSATVNGTREDNLTVDDLL